MHFKIYGKPAYHFCQETSLIRMLVCYYLLCECIMLNICLSVPILMDVFSPAVIDFNDI